MLATIQFSLRSVYIETTLTAQAPTKNSERIPDEASNKSVHIIDRTTGYERTSTSTSRKPLSRDTDDPIELYALSVSQIQVAKEQGMLKGKMIHPDSGRCTMGGVSTDSGEAEVLKGERSDQTARNIADRDATPSDLDLDMLRDLCYKYNQQRAEKTRRQLEEGVISRVEAEWCCRCKMMTDFVEKKCVKQYCEHRRCHYCRDFNRVGEAETGQRMRRGD